MPLDSGNSILGQKHWTRSRETWSLIPALLVTSRATSGDSFHVSGPQLFLSSNGLTLPTTLNSQSSVIHQLLSIYYGPDIILALEMQWKTREAKVLPHGAYLTL